MAGLNPSMTDARQRSDERREPREPRGPRLLMSWEDWLTLAAAALVFLSLAASIQSANLVRDMPAIVPTTIAGLVIGLFAARIAAPQIFVHPVAIVLGAGMVLLATQSYADGATIGERLADFRLRMEEWFHIVRVGDISNDNLPFVTLVQSIAFLVAYFGTWAIYRWHNAWLAVVPVGALLLVNISVMQGQPSTAFVFFLFGALLLIARMHLQKRQAQWRRDGVEYPEFMSLNVAQLTVVLAAGLMILAWMVPLGTQARAVESTINWLTQPVSDQTDHLVRIFHNLDLRGGGDLYTYGDTLPVQGELSLGTRQLMEIHGVDRLDHMMFLRAASYDEYTGVGWRGTDRTQSRVDGGAILVEGETPYQETALSSIEVTMRDRQSVVLFRGTPFGTNVRTLVDAYEGNPGNVDLVRGGRNFREGDTYNAIGIVSTASADQLRNAGQDYPEWVANRYLQMPDEFPGGVHELTAEITAGSASAYDAAAAIEEYLRQLPYDLEVPAAPPGEDTVEFLLNDLQRGHFLYMATAMTMMLRSEGIPARIAIGYAIDPERHDEGPPFIVTREDAYAWVEVFFPGYGWVEFNPTSDRPAGGAGAGMPEEQFPDFGPIGIDPFIDDLMFEEIGGLPEGIQEQLGAEPTEAGGPFPWWILWAFAGLMLAAGAIVAGGYATWNWEVRGLPARAKLWAKTQRLSRWAGMPEAEGETPREWSRRIGRGVEREDAAQTLASAYEESRYGRPDLQRIDDDEATNAYRELRGALIRQLTRRKRKANRDEPPAGA